MNSDADEKKQSEGTPSFVASEDRIEAKIDRDLRDSFPASDPPGWVLGVKRPAAAKEEQIEEQDDDSSSTATGDTGES